MGLLGELKTFWARQSKNFKVFIARDLIGSIVGGEGGIGRYVSIYYKSLGASTVEIGLLDSIANAVRMLVSIPAGFLTDQAKRLKRIYVTGRSLLIPVSLVYAAAQSWQVFIITAIWSALIGRVTMPVENIVYIDSLRNQDRVTGIAVQRTITSAVGLFSPLLVAYLVTIFGGLDNAPSSLRPLYLVEFSVGLTVLILLVTQLQEPNLVRTERKGFMGYMFGMFKEVPGLYRLLLLQVLNTFFNGIRGPFRILYFYEIKNADAFIIGLQGTVATAVSLTLSVPLGRAAERIGRRKFSYYGHIVYALCVLSALVTPRDHPELLLVYSLLSSLGGAMEVGWMAFQQEYIPLEMRGRWAGITTLVTAMANIVAPIIGGLLWNMNPDYAWYIGIVHYAFIALPLMISIPSRPEDKGSN